MTAASVPEISIVEDRAALARASAARFVQAAGEAVSSNGCFAVALSGGTTPRDTYQQLASPDFRGRVDWSRVHLFWGDERAVPPDDPQSNYRMAYDALISRVPIPPANVHPIPAQHPPEQAAEEYERTLREFFSGQIPQFDLVLLGLGTNGHAASLFPHTPVLQEKERWCAAVWVPELNAYRLTLTVPVLNAGALDAFLVSGADKAATVREVIEGAYEPERLPAQLVQPAPGRLLWLLDREAAKELSPGKP